VSGSATRRCPKAGTGSPYEGVVSLFSEHIAALAGLLRDRSCEIDGDGLVARAAIQIDADLTKASRSGVVGGGTSRREIFGMAVRPPTKQIVDL
jgi:hypothetical protein